MQLRNLCAPFIVGSWVLLACQEAQQSAEIVQDSAGVRIVNNAPLDQSEPLGWSVSEDPVLTIGSREGDEPYMLFRVVNAIRFGNGSIAVANAGSNEIRLFDASGNHLRSVGGSGGGPGEFEALSALFAYMADSLLAYDRRSMRVSVFSRSGELGRTSKLDPPPSSETILLLCGAFADGSFLVQPFGRTQAYKAFTPRHLRRTGIHRDTVSLFRYEADGTFVDQVAEFPGTEFYFYQDDDPRNDLQTGGFPFSRRSVFRCREDRLYVGLTDSYQVDVYGLDGSPVSLIRRSHTPQPVTDGDLDAYWRLLEADLDERRQQFYVRRQDVLRQIDTHDNMAAYGDIQVDADGQIWIEESGRPGRSSALWSVFTADGHVLGTVELPNFNTTYPTLSRILQIGSDFILVHRQDELQVEYVDVYSLSR